MVTLPDPYATADDLAAYWRALSSAEQDRATVLLGWAAQLINEQPGSADFDPVTCAQVSMDVVKRAMVASINGDGVSDATSSQSMADMSAATTYRFTNPVGNLYLTSAEVSRLYGRPNGGAGGSLTLSSNVQIPRHWWNHQHSVQCGTDCDVTP